MDGNLSYNSNDLQTFDPATRTGINTNVINHTDLPDSNGQVVPLADIDDSNVPEDNTPYRTVTLGGTIHGSSQADLDDRIDAFKAIFLVRNKYLDITYGSTGTRRYTVMKKGKVSITRQNTTKYATFSVELICKPYGTDTTPTTIMSATGYTSATKTQAATIAGSAPYQLPVATITINSLTGTGDFVQLSNDTNSQGMTVAGLGLAAGDVLVIDASKHEVTLNGDDVDYSGTFLELEPGAQSITYTDGFDTRNVDILVEYTKRYA